MYSIKTNIKKQSIMKNKGFTLVELLIVIGILAILTAAVVIVLNPAELLRQARDSQRLSDLDALKNTISLYLADGLAFPTTYGGFTLGSTCYASVAGATDCNSRATSSRTVIASSSSRLTDGTGWIPLNFASISTGSPLQNLPVDPTNSVTGSLYYSALFDVANGTFELDATIESNKYGPANTGKQWVDGGNSTSVYEVGSDSGLNL
jgi:prepilin-type N-terminal cleavage/methylation domain-containing protein